MSRGFLAERYFVSRYVRLIARAVRLSSVCDVVAPTQRLEQFGNIFAPPNRLRTRTVCVKIFVQKFEAVLGDRAS